MKTRRKRKRSSTGKTRKSKGRKHGSKVCSSVKKARLKRTIRSIKSHVTQLEKELSK